MPPVALEVGLSPEWSEVPEMEWKVGGVPSRGEDDKPSRLGR